MTRGHDTTHFLSIAFWTWMWGPVGASLAAPILLCAIVAARRL